MTMAMVTARVDADNKHDAEQVLRSYGRTYSDIIRDMTDYIARTQQLPLFERELLNLINQDERRKKMNAVTYFAQRKLPAIDETISDEDIVEQERRRRFEDV